jgi:hypothetical protein
MSARGSRCGIVVALLLTLPVFTATAAEPDPDVARLGQRLQAIDTDPQRTAYAAYERLQARQALQSLQAAKRKQRPQALQIAKIRVEAAEIASRTESNRAVLQQLEIERSELLVEASRRDAERARAEAERLRVQAQIQAEETARLREAVEAESRNREEAEGLLDTVAGSEAEKLRLAREREAELARREAELTSGGPVEAAAKPKPKAKPRPKPRPKPKP